MQMSKKGQVNDTVKKRFCKVNCEKWLMLSYMNAAV